MGRPADATRTRAGHPIHTQHDDGRLTVFFSFSVPLRPVGVREQALHATPRRATNPRVGRSGDYPKQLLFLSLWQLVRLQRWEVDVDFGEG